MIRIDNMKNFIYNNQDDKLVNIVQFIKDNESEFKDKFGIKYDFICDYPFVLKFPMEKFLSEKICECCNQRIPNTSKFFTFDDGFRPNIDDISIDLGIISQILLISENQSDILKQEYDNFVSDFRKAFNKII